METELVSETLVLTEHWCGWSPVWFFQNFLSLKSAFVAFVGPIILLLERRLPLLQTLHMVRSVMVLPSQRFQPRSSCLLTVWRGLLFLLSLTYRFCYTHTHVASVSVLVVCIPVQGILLYPEILSPWQCSQQSLIHTSRCSHLMTVKHLPCLLWTRLVAWYETKAGSLSFCTKSHTWIIRSLLLTEFHPSSKQENHSQSCFCLLLHLKMLSVESFSYCSSDLAKLMQISYSVLGLVKFTSEKTHSEFKYWQWTTDVTEWAVNIPRHTGPEFSLWNVLTGPLYIKILIKKHCLPCLVQDGAAVNVLFR
jgi:hypothetical protein